MGYKKDVIKGFSWLGAFRIVTRLLSFIRTAIIARLLTPSQVGIFGIATIVLSLVEILTETGINIFLIQKKENIEHYLSTAWVISIIRGILISIIIYLTSWKVADFYAIPDSVGIIQLIAVVPFLRGFINPAVVTFTKDLSFHKEFYYRTAIFAFESVVSVLLLWFYPTPVSLACGLIIGALFEVILSCSMAKPFPEFSFHLPYFKEILSRGKWLTLTGIFSYLYHNGDNIVVGKMLGTASLGLYQMAYKISSLPISEGSDVVGNVMFPVMVKMKDDLPRLKRAYIRSVMLIAAMVIPVSVIFWLFPNEMIKIALGEQWLAASQVLQILAFFGSVRALSVAINYPIYALGKQEYVTKMTLLSFLGMAITIVPLVTSYGIIGAAYAVLIGTGITIPLVFYYVRKIFS